MNTNHTSILDSIFSRKNGSVLPEKEFQTEDKGRIRLIDWGYEEAGLHRGNPEALGNSLRLIKERHSKDEALNTEEQEKRRDLVRKDIAEKECRVASLVSDCENIRQALIPAREKQVQLHEEELAEMRIRVEEKRISSEFEPARFWMYTVLFVLLTAFLFFFYMSAINAAFFRSMRDVVAGADESNIDIMINSIFDAGNVFTWKSHTIIVLLGASLFLAYGMVPHILMLSKGRYRIFWTALSVLLALAVDALIAYKIDRGIHDLRVMMNMADEGWKWYASINFYLVLAFGFGGYMVWGLLYEAAIAEKGKKNVEVRGKVLIDALKDKIRKLAEEIEELRQRAIGFENEMNRLRLEIGQMTRSMERTLINPQQLLQYYEAFYNGWLRYVNQLPNKEQMRASCEEVLLGCRQSIEKP